jgi:hypothetical protein
MKIQNDQLRATGAILLGIVAILFPAWRLENYFSRGLRGGIIAGTPVGGFYADAGWKIALIAAALSLLMLGALSFTRMRKSWWKLPVAGSLAYSFFFGVVFYFYFRAYSSDYAVMLRLSHLTSTGALVDARAVLTEVLAGIAWTSYVGFVLTCVITLLAYFGSKALLLMFDQSEIDITLHR